MHASRFAWALGLVWAATSMLAWGQSNCGPLQNHYGPFDYRIARDKAVQVESHHFDFGVESLKRGQSGSLGGDIEYLLKVFPNHHRGLVAVMRLGQKMKSEQVEGLSYPVECYFERALRFQPDDAIAKMLYANYLVAKKRVADADLQLQAAISVAGDNPFTHFNIGMMYFDLKNYPLAVSQAHRALALGFTKPDLKNRLVAVGKWVEPAAQAPADPASAPNASGASGATAASAASASSGATPAAAAAPAASAASGQ